MKRISALILGLVLSMVFTWPAGAGTLTTNKFLYKPSLGAKGDTEKDTFAAGLDRVDARLAQESWLGDPNFGATLQTAIAAIGSTPVILRIPYGSWAVAKNTLIPANVVLRFENGGMLDTSALLDAPIEAMTQASACQVTVTGHGLTTGDYVRFYNIQQCYVSNGTHSATHADEWMHNNDYLFQVTVVDANHFTVPFNSSAYHAYNAATDPGRVCTPVRLLGKIEAGKQKIFNISSSAQIWFTNSYGAFSVIDHKAQTDVYPEWFGAAGTGTADDLLYLDACFLSLKYFDKAVGTIHLSNFYGVMNTWSLNEIAKSTIAQLYVIGSGRNTCGIVGLVPSAGTGCDGKPVVEAIAAGSLRFRGFGIYGTSKLTSVSQSTVPGAPSVGLLLGASQTSINGADSKFDDMYFYGWFKRGTVLNRGHAQSTFTDHETNVQAWYDGATPSYAFDYFFGAGDRPLIWSDLVPTNSAWNTWSSNRDCQGTVCKIIKTVTYGTYATGSACVYLDKAGGTYLEGVLWGGQARGYGISACNGAPGWVHGCGGDGYGSLANIYLWSDSGGSGYPNCAVSVVIDGAGGSLGGVTALKTDAYTTLINSRISNLYGNNGYTIALGAGLSYSRIENLWANLTSFTIVGAIYGSHIEVPESCTNFTYPANNNGGSIVVRRGPYSNGGIKTIIAGDLDLGMTNANTSPVLTLMPYKLLWKSAVPTTNGESYKQGSVIWKIGAASGTSPGWFCRLDNTIGTLNSGATIGSITTGTNTLTVNSVTGLKIGDFIDVEAVGGGNAVSVGRVTNVDATGKIVTLAANATGMATSTVVSYHNETTAAAFEAMPATLARTSGVTSAIATGTTVTHGLGLTPTKVLLTSVDGVPTGIYPGSLGATTFAVNFAGGGSHAFYWEAIQ